MPIYEYRCKSCGQVTEIIQKVNSPKRRRCSECHGSLEKLISRTAFLLKGGGWYADGYSKGAGSSTETKTGGDSPASKSSSASKSDKSKKSDKSDKAASAA